VAARGVGVSPERAIATSEFGEYETLLVTRAEGIVQVTLNRPERLNAFTDTMLEELPSAAARIDADNSVRAVVLTGAGRAFSAGADIARLAERAASRPALRPPSPAGIEGELLSQLGIPVVAAVNGAAAGLGMGLALAADFRIASPKAFFVEAHVARGLTPSVACWYLARMVGLTRAMEIVLLGDRVSAQDALQWGIVNKVVEEDGLLAEAWSVAERIAQLPALTVRMAKATMHRALELTLEETRRSAGWSQLVTKLLTEEHTEGAESFRRSPPVPHTAGAQDDV
jgi:2-(1,2-epoxy-1,2-dihydrophenyl)acetyl-CoA isomerase